MQVSLEVFDIIRKTMSQIFFCICYYTPLTYSSIVVLMKYFICLKTNRQISDKNLLHVFNSLKIYKEMKLVST